MGFRVWDLKWAQGVVVSGLGPLGFCCFGGAQQLFAAAGFGVFQFLAQDLFAVETGDEICSCESSCSLVDGP